MNLETLPRHEQRAVTAALKAAPEILALPPEIQAQAIESIVADVREKQQKVRNLLVEVEATRDKYVKAKGPIEQRWIDDIRQLEGEDRTRPDKTQPSSSSDDSAPRLNLTQSRTNSVSARIRDMMVPANDTNWQLDVDDTDGLDPEQLAEAEKACERMSGRIAAALKNSDYSENMRRMIDSACELGMGVLKGPFNKSIEKRKFQTLTAPNGEAWSTITVDRKTSPACEYVDPWMFYPELTRTMAECSRAYQLHLMTREQLKLLATQPGFDAQAISDLLEMEPELGEVGNNLRKRNMHCSLKEEISDRYAVWEMHGVLSKDELEILGIKDEIQSIPTSCLWFCQGLALKVKVSPMETDTRLPYYVFNYQRADDTMCGYGVPYLMRHQQRVYDATWLIGLHNASVSSGPQIFIRDGKVIPADGKYQIRGPKVWKVKDDSVKVDDVMSSIVLQNNLDQILKLLEKAIELGDETISLPMMASGGEPNVAHQTASGLVQMLNANNIVQRRAAKTIDDHVITPLVERFYWWFMLYDPDPSIKVNACVSARGTSVLLYKDVHAQHLQVIAQLTADPRFAPAVDSYEMLKRIFESADVVTEGLLYDRATYEKNKQGSAQPDPKVQAAQIEQQTRGMEIESAERVAAMRAESEARTSQARLIEAQMNLAADEKLTIAEVGAKFNLQAQQEETKRYIASLNAGQKAREHAGNITLEAEKIAQKEQSERRQMAVETPVRLA